MTTVELIAKLSALARPLMTAYGSDLDLDLQCIVAHPYPFLHWTRKTGTDLAILWPAAHEKFPKSGEKVQYLFGTCDRRELAHKPTEQAEYWAHHGCELCLYYDGMSLRTITVHQALSVAQEYYRATIRAWQPRVRVGGARAEVCVYTD